MTLALLMPTKSKEESISSPQGIELSIQLFVTAPANCSSVTETSQSPFRSPGPRMQYTRSSHLTANGLAFSRERNSDECR